MTLWLCGGFYKAPSARPFPRERGRKGTLPPTPSRGAREGEPELELEHGG